MTLERRISTLEMGLGTEMVNFDDWLPGLPAMPVRKFRELIEEVSRHRSTLPVIPDLTRGSGTTVTRRDDGRDE